MQQADIREVSGPTWSGVFLGKKAEITAGSLRTMLDYLKTAAFPSEHQHHLFVLESRQIPFDVCSPLKVEKYLKELAQHYRSIIDLYLYSCTLIPCQPSVIAARCYVWIPEIDMNSRILVILEKRSTEDR